MLIIQLVVFFFKETESCLGFQVIQNTEEVAALFKFRENIVVENDVHFHFSAKTHVYVCFRYIIYDTKKRLFHFTFEIFFSRKIKN